MEVTEQIIRKHATPCCAMALLHGMNNNTTYSQLSNLLERLREEKVNNTEVGVSTGNGQTLLQAVVSPGEYKLREVLEKAGFVKAFEFERRVGYPKTGNLEMFMVHL